jgi:hypothetical protein
MQKLHETCIERKTVNGVSGILAGNSILLFLPAAGYRNYNSIVPKKVDIYGHYWNSEFYNKSYYNLSFDSTEVYFGEASCVDYFSVRCVAK